MKAVLIALTLFVALEPHTHAQSLAEFQRDFTENCVGLGQERNRDLDKLAANYIKALTDLGEKAKQSGSLDAVLPVRDEIAAVQGAKWPLPFLGKTAPKRLRELRDTYIEERGKIEDGHSKRLGELVQKTTELLKQREVELTKAGDVDGALNAREMAATISNGNGAKAARSAIPIQPAGSPTSGWISLCSVAWQKLEGCDYFQNDLKKDGEILLNAELFRTGQNLLPAHAPSKYSYQFDRTITAFKCRGHLVKDSRLGNVIFTVATDKGEVYRSTPVTPGQNVVEISLSFEPTRTLELSVESNGPSHEDWAAWLEPMVVGPSGIGPLRSDYRAPDERSFKDGIR